MSTSLEVRAPDGALIGHVGHGSRKDIRNAVEAATAAQPGWAKCSAHLRAQILYYIGENLDARAEEFATRLRHMTGASASAARREVGASVDRFFTYAAWADKYDGRVHAVPIRGLALAMNEPVGIIGIAAPDDAPLLGAVSLIASAIAMGNAVIAIPSGAHPLAATDLYQVLDTSDLPGGVVNIVTGPRDDLSATLADHYGVDGLWYHGSPKGAETVERLSACNLKRTWVQSARIDWHHTAQAEGEAFLRAATAVKNIWVPYGE